MNSRRLSALVAAFVLPLGGCGGGGSSSPPPPPPPPPAISAFAATPPAITPGASSTLAWTVSGATSLTVDQGVGSVAGTSVAVHPQATTTYTLTATNAGGSATATATVRVGSAPVISGFGANPSWVTTGQSAALTWSVSGATALSIDSIGSVSGSSVQVNPTADASYVLTASNDFGSTQAQATLAVFRPPTVWFAPIWDTVQVPLYGAPDYFALFNPAAPWANAASHVTVFKIYAGILDAFDDATLRNMLADLKRRHIALAMEWGALEPADNCDPGIEGFGPPGNGLHSAQRIRDLGGSLQYVAFDEPFEFGSVYTGPNACRWTAQQVAHYAAQHLAEIRSVFPDVVAGDIEVLPEGDAIDTWLGAYQQWFDAWQEETGRPLAFFHFDVDWASDWKPAAVALARALRARHIPVGQIYIGANDATTDSDWVTSAELRAADVETAVGLKPDQIIFQSWESLPHHLLPETDPSAFTYLIDWYFRDRTQLTLSAPAGRAQGQLSGPGGPLAQTTLQLTATPSAGTGQVATYQYSGNVPSGTQYVVFGARAGIEGCDVVGAQPAEFLLTDFTLDAGAAGQLTDDFTNGLVGWGIWGNASVAQLQGASLHVLVAPGQTLGLNSASLPFPAAAAAYTLTVHATIPSGGAGGGCAIAVFQDSTYSEITRAVIPIVPLQVSFGPVQTDANGIYSVPLAPLPAGSTLSAQYAGSNTLWPAAASVVLGPLAVPAIATASLPDGTIGSAYAQTLAVAGGIPPYLWVAGSLPPGLSLRQDGALSGTPTAPGTYTLALSVVDHAASPQAADASLQLVIH